MKILQKQIITSLAYGKECLLKRFKESERFLKIVKKFGISNSTSILKTRSW